MLRTLAIEDRLALATILKMCRGNYGMLCLAEKLEKDILSDEHKAEMKLTAGRDGMGWMRFNDEGEPIELTIKYDFGKEAEELIIKNLIQMAEAQMLEHAHKRLYEMFILTPVNKD